VKDEQSLLAACRLIEGMTFAQIASQLNLTVSERAVSRKGWVGCAIEKLLGAEAACKPIPDFISLGIELKTLPLNQHGKPTESTFVTSLSLLKLHLETWETSSCWSKLKRVLWIPVEADKQVPFLARRVGQAMLWSPNEAQVQTLKRDWIELTSLIVLGRMNEVSAQLGEYLQIRPKAANGRSLSGAYDADGNKTLTLPRGFYLRAGFTETIYKSSL
jgi:DNA mismatch repair protein MutH